MSAIPRNLHCIVPTGRIIGTLRRALFAFAAASLAVGSAHALPSITTPPGNATACAGGSATFQVAASGTDPVSYAWYFNGTTLLTSTSNTLVLTVVQGANAGNYTVVVTDVDGSVTNDPPAVLAVNALPIVTVNSATICPGDSATLTATHNAASPSYLWSPGGATTSSITVSPGSTTTYSVVVTDGATSCAGTNSGTVTVRTPVSISGLSSTASGQYGSTITLAPTVGGTSPSFQWYFNNATKAGATSSTLALAKFAPADAGNYYLVASNACGAVTSVVVAVSGQSKVIFADDFESGTMTNWAINTSALTASSLRSRVPGTGFSAYSATPGNRMHRNVIADNAGSEIAGHVVLSFYMWDDGVNFAAINDFRGHSGGTGVSPSGGTTVNGTLAFLMGVGKNTTVDLPGETFDATKYQARLNFSTNSGTFRYFNLNGSGAPSRSVGWHRFDVERQTDGTTLRYFVDNVLVRTITGAVYEPLDSLIMGTGAGSSANNVWYDGFSVVSGNPVISTQPQGISTTGGSNVALSVYAVGGVTYQWYTNGVALTGATKETLTLNNIQLANAANYTVVVGNTIGSVTSQVATVTVTPGPVNATSTLTSVAIPAGQSANLTAPAATGPGPFTYQWYFNGAAIAGANSSTLPVTGINADQSGVYSVGISNSQGGVRVVAAVVMVQPSLGSAAVFQDFNTAGSFTNNWQVKSNLGGLLVGAGTYYGETNVNGLQNSRALIVLTNTTAAQVPDATAIFTNRSFDFSQNGQALGISTMFKTKASGNAASGRFQFGFINENNNTLNDNAGTSFMSLRINPGANLTYTFEQQTKSNTPVATVFSGNAATLLNNRWYKYVVYFENTKGTTAATFRLSGAVIDYGTDGQTLGPITHIFGPTTITNGDITADSSVWPAIRWQQSSGIDYLDNLAVWTSPPPITIVKNATNQIVTAGQQLTFAISAEAGSVAPSLQWYSNNVAIPGAINNTYTTPFLTTSANGAQYKVVATTPFANNSATCNVATVMVNADTVAPAVVSAGSLDGSVVGVRFSESMDPLLAANSGNYSINGATILNSAVQPDGRTVALRLLSPVSDGFSVTVSGLKDVSGNALATTTVNGSVLGMTGTDLNNPLTYGSSLAWGSGEVDVVAGGSDIWGNSDQGHVVLGNKTGDFDVVVRLENMIRPFPSLIAEPAGRSDTAKAGIMVREDLSVVSRTLHTIYMPTNFGPLPGNYGYPGGLNRSENGTRAQAFNTTAAFPTQNGPGAAFPNGWLRLRRINNTFLSYTSTDGINWQNNASSVQTYPDTVFLGLEATAHANLANYGLQVQFRNFGDFTYSPAPVISLTSDLQPLSVPSINAGQTVTFSVSATVSGAPSSELGFVWQKSNGSGGFTNIPDANGATLVYTTPGLTAADSGAQWRVMIKAPGADPVISSVATVTTVNDTAGPTLVNAVTFGSANTVNLFFSEPVSAATALTLGNYSITNGVGNVIPVTGAAFFRSQTNVVLTTALSLTNGYYGVTVTGVRDASPAVNLINPNPSLKSFSNGFLVPITGTVLIEAFTNITGTSVLDITNNAAYLNNAFSAVLYNSVFAHNLVSGFPDTTVNVGWKDNYGARISGFFTPPSNGVYRFYIRSDDSSMLSLNGVVIAYENAANQNYGAVTINAPPTFRTSVGIPLTGGVKYYMQGILKEGTGGDGFSMAFRESQDLTTPQNIEGASGTFFTVPDGPISSGTVIPTNPTVMEGSNITFAAVNFVGRPPILYQWRKNGVDIPGATTGFLDVTAGAANNGDVYTVQIFNSFSSNSASSTVTVQADTTAPVLLGASGTSSLGEIVLSFSEPVAAASALNVANYSITPSLSVASASLDETGTKVTLRTSAQMEGMQYTVTVNNVTDSSTAANAVAANSSASFLAWVYAPGYVTLEIWNSLFNPVGGGSAVVEDIKSSPRFPNKPDLRYFTNLVEYAPNLDSYGDRFVGYITPTNTGYHVIYIAHDDGALLRLSPDSNPANVRDAILQNNVQNTPYADNNNSVTNFMTAGQKYYFELFHKENTGGDYIRLAIRVPGDTTPNALLLTARGALIATANDPATVTNSLGFKVVPTDAPPTPENSTATFSGMATNTGGLAVWYQWQKNGVDIPGANSTNYTTDLLVMGSTDVYRLVASVPGRKVYSDPVTVPVIADTFPPQIVGAAGDATYRKVTVVFSEPVMTASANDTANYSLIDSASTAVNVLAAALQADNRTVVLTTGFMQPGLAHTLTANGVLDSKGNPSSASYLFYAPQGAITRKVYGIAGANIPGTAVSALTADSRFINDTPDLVEQRTQFISDFNNGVAPDNYGSQFKGYVIPPLTGNYTFYVCSDDSSELYLSTDENPGNKVLIAREEQWSGPRDWASNASGRRTINPATGRYFNQSAVISMQAGKRYYVEALQKEGGGSDHLGVTWQVPGAPVPVTNGPAILADGLSTITNSVAVTIGGLGDISASENEVVTLAPVTTGFPTPPYQWYKNGAAIPGATGPTYTTPLLTTNDNNAVFYLVAYNAITSTPPAVLHVAPDVVAPSIASARGHQSLQGVQVLFNERVNPSTATNPASYMVTDFGAPSSVVIGPSGSNVFLSFATAMAAGTVYELQVMNVADRAVASNVLSSASISFTSWSYVTNFVLREQYRNSPAGSQLLTTLFGQANYPFFPDVVDYSGAFATSPRCCGQSGLDNYGERISGFFIPPVSGNYTFYMLNDDEGMLRFGADPASATNVMDRVCCNNPPFNDATGVVVPNLTAGQAYYIEGLFKEGTGGDGLDIAVREPTNTIATASLTAIPAAYLATYADVTAISLTITNQPASTNVNEFQTATLRVGASVTPANLASQLLYQWQSFDGGVNDFTNIAGANASTYVTVPMSPRDGDYQYRAIVQAPGYMAVSDTVTVTVTPDTTAPTIVSVGSLDGTVIGVCFSESVTLESINDPFNWYINGEDESHLTVSSIGWSTDFKTAYLTNSFTLPGDAFTVKAYFLQDRSVAGNLANDVRASGHIEHLLNQDVGVAGVDPINPGSVLVCASNVFNVTAGGSDIWNSSNAMHFIYTQLTNEFDVRMRVQSLDPVNQNSKAGLVATESILDPGSKNVNLVVTPSAVPITYSPTLLGANNYQANYRAAQNGTSAQWPIGGRQAGVPYPNAWMRLTRSANTFVAFYGSNGSDWTAFATNTVSPAYSNTLYVGMAVTSHDNTNGHIVNAVMSDWFVVPAPVIVTSPTDVTVGAGQTATFNVAASGVAQGGPLSYQWRFNGVNIANETSATLTIANAQQANAGTYDVVVRNTGGSSISAAATLAFANAPMITQQPASTSADCQGSANFSVSVSSSTPVTYQWYFNGTTVIPDATNSTLTVTNVSASSAGSYSVLVSNAGGGVTSDPATLTVVVVPAQFTAQPQDQSSGTGTSASFSAATTACGPVTYQWYFGDSVLSGQTAATLTIPNVQFANAGNYYLVATTSGGASTSRVATLTVFFQSQTLLGVDINLRTADTPATTQAGFSNFVIGSVGGTAFKQTNATVRSYGPYTVTMTGNGVSDPGYIDRQRTTPVANGAFTQEQLLRDLVFSQGTAADSGLNVAIDGLTAGQVYAVTIWSFDTGSTGNRVSDWFANGFLVMDNWTFNGSNLPTNDLQYQFTFKAVASPSGQILVQGRRDSATGSGNPGVFLNGFRVATAIADPPAITQQPFDTTVYAGDNAILSATAGTGTRPVTYQWLKAGSPIGGATNTTLVLANAQASDAAQYSLVAANQAGSATSAVAQVTVLPVAGLTTALVSDWPLASIGATTPDIISGNDLSAVNMDVSNVAAGQCGRAAIFNGTDELLVHTNGGGLPIYSSPNFTVSLWVKGNGVGQGDRRIFAEGATNNNNPIFSLGTDSGGATNLLDVFIRNDNGSNPINHKKSSVPVLDGQWHHVAWVDRNGFAQLFVDGVLDTNDFTYARGVLTAHTTSLGALARATNSSFFAGAIDNVIVWHRSLSAAEVTYVKNNGTVTTPVIACPPDVTVYADADQNSKTGVALGNPDLGENCNILNVANNAPSSFPVGTTVVTWTVTDQNGNSSTCTQNVTVLPNHSPVAGNDGGATRTNTPISFTTATLLANDSDADGDTLTVTGVSATSTNGGTVTLSAGTVTYVPVNNFSGTDRFTYTITDARGNTATGIVEVAVVNGNVPAANSVTIGHSGSSYLLRFSGVAGQTYEIKRSANVAGPYTTIQTVVAPLSGVIEFTDPNPPQPSAYYRLFKP